MDAHVLDSELGPRRVDVWVPPGADGPLPVVYAHDGQNVFDPATASDGVPWALDRAVERLRAEHGLPGAVVVGLWHGDDRWGEYLPPVLDAAEAGRRRPAGAGATDRATQVLAFVTDVVKPMVDRAYPTRPEPGSTSVLGSSMGGLAALHVLEARPDVFGAAACLSTHWPAGGDALVDAMADRLPAPGRHRLYFDHGTEDLDAAYAPFQARFDAALHARGYRAGADCLSVTFPGAEHHERAWAARARVPLLFLLAGAGAAAASATAFGGRPAPG